MTGARHDRRLSLAIAAIVALGLAAGCTKAGGDSGNPAPSGSADGVGAIGDAGATEAPAALSEGVAAIVSRQTLLLPDGGAVSLAGIEGGALSGVQTPDGWLVRGYGNGIDRLTLWLVRPDGALRRIVEKADAPVAVAADGRRIAWRSADRLYVGHIDLDKGAVVEKTSSAPERGAPMALTKESVVLGYSATGGGVDNYDVWFPDRGEYKPTWDKTQHVRAVYRTPARGSSNYLGQVVGPAGGKDLCIAELDPRDNLKAVRTACGLPMLLDDTAAVSPDARWLAFQSATESGRGEVAVADLTTFFNKPAVSVKWPAPLVGVWESPNTMLARTDERSGALAHFKLGSSAGEPVQRAGITGPDVTLLPRLGA